MELKEQTDRYRNAIRQLERMANLNPCEYCGCNHPVRLHVGMNLQVTPNYSFPLPCDDHKRDLMSEIRAIQKRMGFPENIC